MKQQNKLNRPRREFLGRSVLAGLSLSIPDIGVAFPQTDARFVFIILRGALDGLAAVAPYGDGNYQRVRGALALQQPGLSGGALKLDGMFALNPALQSMHALFQVNQLLVLHAIASPYRDRSHFDGQDLLENGTTTPHGSLDGWLNRALLSMPASKQQKTEQMAMAFAQNLPLVLRGDVKVGSWAPSRLPETDDDTMQRIVALYGSDEYFLSRLQTAMATDAIAGDQGKRMSANMSTQRNNSLASVASAAAKLLQQHDGPRVAVMESTGWDTHANQGAEQGQLFLKLAELDRAMEGLKEGLGSVWGNTVVMVATEFGRTVAINGSRGTDHGTAACAFLAGGAVNGGRVIADWPGLAAHNLYQGRDLQPTLDLRSVFKGVLATHMGVNESVLETNIFVDSRAAQPMMNLTRSV